MIEIIRNLCYFLGTFSMILGLMLLIENLYKKYFKKENLSDIIIIKIILLMFIGMVVTRFIDIEEELVNIKNEMEVLHDFDNKK